MVTFRYDAGDGQVTELESQDGEFEYVTESGYWVIATGHDEDGDKVTLVPDERIYEVRARRGLVHGELRS